ncbi:hypothetical protein GM547_14310 [Streptococcus pneumoniae]|nr:hypothetical protein [Streptococcus pneumoniae]
MSNIRKWDGFSLVNVLSVIPVSKEDDEEGGQEGQRKRDEKVGMLV